jgi:hypothetical protein
MEEFTYCLSLPQLTLSMILHMILHRATGIVTMSLWWRSSFMAKLFLKNHGAKLLDDMVMWKPSFVAHHDATSGIFKGRARFFCVTVKISSRGADISKEAWEPSFRRVMCLKNGCVNCE